MSEQSSSSAPTSENVESETLDAPSATGKGKKDLLMKIVAVLIVVMLVGVAAWYLLKNPGTPLIDPELSATISPSNPTVAAGGTVTMNCTPSVDGTSRPTWTNISYKWSVSPSTLGSYNLQAQRSVIFTAGAEGGSGTLKCNVTYTFDSDPGDLVKTEKRYRNVSTSVTVEPPFLATIQITPSSINQMPGTAAIYNATALSSVQGPITADTAFTWTISGDASAGCTLNSSTSWSVEFTAGTTEGNVTLSVEGTHLGVTADANATGVITAVLSPRTVDYVWHDMFNVPFDEWRYRRAQVYGDEVPITTSYPYIYIWKGQPPGNWYRYSNLRLSIVGHNMTEINMNQRPEFLPLFGTARGGTATIDWNLDYVSASDYPNYPQPVQDNDDGWLSIINGTVTLDEQAAMAVLGVPSHDAWLNFTADWWPTNGVNVATRWSNWFDSEAGVYNPTTGRGLDIYCAYGSGLLPIAWELTAVKVGDKVVLSMDYVSWGGEILLTRWMHESFMSTEWYFEGGYFHMTIGPKMADIDFDSAVSYGMYAYEETLNAGQPCWVWEAMLQDYITVFGHKSDYRKYVIPVEYKYLNTAPGTYWYNANMTYDYTPGAFNLTYGETLKFIWPSADQTFLLHDGAYKTKNATGEMVMEFGEPMASDNPELAPGNVVVDNIGKTMFYTGPIDMWHWSYNVSLPGYRAPHDWLNSEWNRLHLLPYGSPYLEWKMAGAEVIDHFTVSGAKDPVNVTESTGVTVTAYNNHGSVMTGYTGTITFGSSDLSASLPSDYPFVAGDSGVHVFSGTTFATVGTQNITVQDTVATAAKGSQEGIDVQAAPAAASIVVSGIQTNRVVETPLSVTVTVLDQRGYTFVDYVGTVNFTSNMSYADVTLPADYTFTLADQGVYTFTDAVVLHSEGWYTVTCTDTVDSAVTGSQTDIRALLTPSVLDHLVITGPTTASVGAPFSVIVTAYDQYGDVFDLYDGLVSFSTNASAGTYTLPSDYLFVAATDAGSHVFTDGVAFAVVGEYSVVVSDVANGTSASLDNIVVSARQQEIKYRMYDMMMQPWGQWFPWRYPTYVTDIVLNTNPGESTMIYNPDKNGMQGILYAPYRWNVTAKNMTTIDVGAPLVMPANGTPDVPGAAASVNIYMEYLDDQWWLDYWWGQWHTDPTWTGNTTMVKERGDGYYLGVVYTVVMNREAADEWMGMPQADDVAAWWAANGAAYKTAWKNWIMWQGNEIYDIYCGYEFAYASMELYMKCTELPTGDVELEIAHVSWGFEVLITRWMRAADICQHQPYMEDLTLNAYYNPLYADLTYDAVAQYSLRAVQANESAGTDMAWQWEPQGIDYIASISGHHSDYDPWALLTYTSHNVMDPMMGSEVAYDAVPNTFNLTDYMTFEIQLRDGTNVLGYNAVKGDIWFDPGFGMDITPIINVVYYGDKSNYTSQEIHGWMSLGYYEASGMDLDSMYDNGTKTLTIHGPHDFENFGRGVGNARYRGAPLIEFNVTTIVAKATSVPEVSAPDVPVTTASEPAAASSALLSIAVVASATLMTVAVLGGVMRREE